MNINTTTIELVKNTKKDSYHNLPNTMSNYAPFVQGEYYDKIDFSKRDTLCYIKIKKSNVWLHKNDKSTSGIEWINGDVNPMLCWIEYLRNPLFVIYTPNAYGDFSMKFIKYEDTANGFKISVVDNVCKSTVFAYDRIGLHAYLAQSVDTM